MWCIATSGQGKQAGDRSVGRMVEFLGSGILGE
jgi:hypothetical protein